MCHSTLGLRVIKKKKKKKKKKFETRSCQSFHERLFNPNASPPKPRGVSRSGNTAAP
jgi:hypothetical protein